MAEKHINTVRGFDGRRLPGPEVYIPESSAECALAVIAAVNEHGNACNILCVSTCHLIREYNVDRPISTLISLEKLKGMVLVDDTIAELTCHIEAGVTFSEAIAFLAAQDPPLELHQLVNTPKVSVVGACMTASHGMSLHTDTEGGCVSSYVTSVYYVDGDGETKIATADSPNSALLPVLRATYGAVLVSAVDIRVRPQTWVKTSLKTHKMVDEYTHIQLDEHNPLPTSLSELVRDRITVGAFGMSADIRPQCIPCAVQRATDGCGQDDCYCCCEVSGCCVLSPNLVVHKVTQVAEPPADELVNCCGYQRNTRAGANRDCGEHVSIACLSPISWLINTLGWGCLLNVNRCRGPAADSEVIEPWSLYLTHTMSDNALFFRVADAEVLVPIGRLSGALQLITYYLSVRYSFHEYQLYTRYTQPSSGVAIYQQPSEEPLAEDWLWIGFRVLREDGRADIEHLVNVLVQDYEARVHGAKLGQPRQEVARPASLSALHQGEGKERFSLLH